MLSRLAVAIAVVGAGATNPGSLPEVESVLTKATDKMQSFAAQASAMQARVAEKQKASRAALAAQKAKYEGQLATQVQENKDVGAANDGIRADISALDHDNSELKKATDKLRQDNKVMHDTLNGILTKVNAADLFLGDSLRLTDDSDVAELNVLQAPKPEPTLEHFLDVARTDFTGESAGAKNALSLSQISKNDLFSDVPQSLLQLSASRKKPSAEQNPEDFVELLSNGLADIAQAEKEGIAQMEANFKLIFEQGEKEHQSLLSVQKELNETRTSMTAHKVSLTTARDHLKGTGDQLRQRLHGLRIFARKVDDAAGDALKSMKGPKPVSPASTEVKAAPAAPQKNATLARKQKKGGRGGQSAKSAALLEIKNPAAPQVAAGARLRGPQSESFLSHFAHSLR